MKWSDPEVIKHFYGQLNWCSTQLSMKFVMLSCWHFNIYYHDNYNSWAFESKKILIFEHFSFYPLVKIHAQLSWAWKKFHNLRACLHSEDDQPGHWSV